MALPLPPRPCPCTLSRLGPPFRAKTAGTALFQWFSTRRERPRDEQAIARALLITLLGKHAHSQPPYGTNLSCTYFATAAALRPLQGHTQLSPHVGATPVSTTAP